MGTLTKIQSKINSLKPGEQLILSKSKIGTVKHVERSGKGDKLRFVTTFKNGSFEVLATISF